MTFASARLRAGSALLAAVVACAHDFAPARASDGAAPAPGPAAVPPAPATDRDAVLLVIAPRSLAAAMEPLVVHKTKTGMPARLVVIESLDRRSGRDDAERVKRAILASHEQHGTRYVLLAGDASAFPVRFRLVREVAASADADGTYVPTDLYYANLYRDHVPGQDAADPSVIAHSPAFGDWDGDGDGAFDEQHSADDALTYDPDHVDGCPDVAVGRLPAHTAREASAYVDKVIRYETDSGIFCSKLQKLALLADRECTESMARCDAVADAAPARRLLLNCPSADDAKAPWTKAGFRAIRMEVMCSGWIVHVGNATATSWRVHEAGQEFDAAWVAKLRGGDSLRAAVFSVGGATGGFARRAPSERYVDETGRAHEFVRRRTPQAGSSNYDPFSSDYNQAEEEAYAWVHPGYAEKFNPSAAAGAWRDNVNGEAIRDRLLVPRPCNYDLPENRDRTFACSWLAAEGAAIVFAGETVECPNETGAELLRDVLAGRSAKPQILGDLWIEGQRRYWLANRASEGVWRNPRVYLGIMTLFGDPSLRVPGYAEMAK